MYIYFSYSNYIKKKTFVYVFILVNPLKKKKKFFFFYLFFFFFNYFYYYI